MEGTSATLPTRWARLLKSYFLLKTFLLDVAVEEYVLDLQTKPVMSILSQCLLKQSVPLILVLACSYRCAAPDDPFSPTRPAHRLLGIFGPPPPPPPPPNPPPSFPPPNPARVVSSGLLWDWGASGTFAGALGGGGGRRDVRGNDDNKMMTIV